MLLWGFVLQPSEKKPFEIAGSLKTIFLIAIMASLIVAILVSTNYWEKLVNYVTSESGFVINVVTLVVMGVAAWLVIKYSGEKKSNP